LKGKSFRKIRVRVGIGPVLAFRVFAHGKSRYVSWGYERKKRVTTGHELARTVGKARYALGCALAFFADAAGFASGIGALFFGPTLALMTSTISAMSTPAAGFGTATSTFGTATSSPYWDSDGNACTPGLCRV
jgi:hypothetical protein